MREVKTWCARGKTLGRMSPAESELRKEENSAETIDCAMLSAMVDQVSGTEFTAASFTVDGLIYEVSFARVWHRTYSFSSDQ